MRSVRTERKAVSIDPVKLSSPLGAVLVFLGMDRAVPVLHGSQGCAAFAKNLLTRHFREPIPLQTTALTQETVIMGAGEAVQQALDNIVRKQSPSLIGMITTALTETAGDDIDGTVRQYLRERPFKTPVVVVHAPDFSGGLSTGFALAVEAVIDACIPPRKDGQPLNAGQVNLVFGPAYGPGDVEEVKRIVSAMDLVPLALPDFSTSLDGHLGDGFLDVTDGGIAPADLARMSRSAYTFSFGASVRKAGEKLAARARGRHVHVGHLNDLESVDRFVDILADIRGGPVPERLLADRRRLMDRMLDIHSLFSGVRVVLAGEPDWLYMTRAAFEGMGASVAAAVAGDDPGSFGYAEKWMIGDFDDLERWVTGSRSGAVDLWISNSHGARSARRAGVPFMSAGIPVWDRIGAPNEASVGYRGLWEWLARVGSRLMETGARHHAGGDVLL